MQQPTNSLERPQNAGEKISLKTAIERTRLFREAYIQKKPEVQEIIKGNLFSKKLILDVLSQPGCEGIRIYHSLNPGPVTDAPDSHGPIRELILVGTDKNDNDLLSTDDYHGGGKDKKGCNPLSAILALPASPPPAQDAVLIAVPRPCPNMCGSPNALNGSI